MRVRVLRGLAVGVTLLLLLLAVFAVHASGQGLLAAVLLAVGVLAVWVYASPSTGASRYLLPGVAAALVFVVFPMLYTMGMGFTNYSARNLLEFEQARAQLLADWTLVDGSMRSFSLHRHPDGLRLQLGAAEDGRGAPALLSAPLGSQPDVVLQVGRSDQPALPLNEHVEQLAVLRGLSLVLPEGGRLRLVNLRSFGETHSLYRADPDGALTDTLSGRRYLRDDDQGFYTAADGEQLQPGYRVSIGWRHYARIFGDERFRAPFLSVFVWTVVFAALSVLLAASLGLVLAVILNWEALEGRAVYRLVLFLPYAVPSFISILVFKGLFNQNLGELNLILSGLFGIKPAWFSDPLLAKTMLLIVNVWLGFPYMMVLCTGLIKAIPSDLYEASAVAGAGPWVNFWKLTMPLIVKPLTPLLISAFAFNFNNFVLISLLTGGRPDQLDTSLPAGTTDILVSYTWRIAFQDSGQQFGLASAISTVIFLIVAAITLVQMKLTRVADDGGKRR